MSSSYEEVFDEFTDRQLVSILEEADYENVRIVKRGLIAFTRDGMNYLVSNGYDDSIEIFMAFNDIDISFKEMNKWNCEKRFITVQKIFSLSRLGGLASLLKMFK
ncbi:hypothetical protein [Mannheimia bovis]|uniref:Rhodanese domain-containing protein n=1 Tax=Mannheimia bovis TaxID=2770636 RepID=A0A7H1C4Q2_9PAST|nr:hypothetical protein [Mannheimia bovis]QNS15957.1 hypothetical protein ICJ55_04300 [Mannheimia bovis]